MLLVFKIDGIAMNFCTADARKRFKLAITYLEKNLIVDSAIQSANLIQSDRNALLQNKFYTHNT